MVAPTAPRFQTRPVDEEKVKILTAEQKCSPAMARLLASRGVDCVAESMDSSMSKALSVDSLTNSKKMASLMADKMAEGKRFLVVADYDSDGATSCAIAMRAMKGFSANIDYVVPNRFVDGYGLTPEIVNRAALMNPRPDCIITVDNGIASVDGIARANVLGISVLVTDHHLPGDIDPAAECMVNPNQRGCTFGSKNLAGCGVIFYVMMALKMELDKRGWFKTHPSFTVSSLLDYVALGTVADVVKLDNNNRRLVTEGLKMMRAGRAHLGIQALLRIAGRDIEKVNSFDMGFAVGPRLNAAGRLDDMSIGISCLLADTEEEAEQLATRLDSLNKERRSIESDMTAQAITQIDDMIVAPEDKFTMTLFHPDWHEGVIGILASRVKDKCNRPTIAFGRGTGGHLKGSCRSIPALHLRDALDIVYKRNPGLIIKFGGHSMAAGLTIMETDLARFTVEFEDACRSMITTSDLDLVIATDGKLHPSDATIGFAEEIKSMVWGQGFPEPLFQGEFTVLNQDYIGKDKNHSRLRLGMGAQAFEAILFQQGEPLPNMIRATFSLDVNEWKGSKKLQLKLQKFEDGTKPMMVHDAVFHSGPQGLAI
jgi:single-stranded-DNA-specific exonuclease